MSHLRCPLVLILTALLPSVPAFSKDSQRLGDPVSNKADEVFQTAVDSIATNYEHLQTVLVTIEKLIVNPSVERRETITRNVDRGRVSVTVAPVSISRSIVTLEGRNLRSESYERVGSDCNDVGTIVRKDDVWTKFMRTNNWVQIKLTHQLGGFMTKDPREFGGLDQRHGLLEQMRRSKARSVTQTNEIVEVVAEIVDIPEYGYRRGQQFTYLFDTSRNFLPTQVIRHFDDGSINVLTELTYEEVVPEKSWFVRGMTKKFFMNDVAAKKPSSKTWHQLLVYNVVGSIRINEELDDDFTIEIPLGTRVVDVTHVNTGVDQ